MLPLEVGLPYSAGVLLRVLKLIQTQLLPLPPEPAMMLHDFADVPTLVLRLSHRAWVLGQQHLLPKHAELDLLMGFSLEMACLGTWEATLTLLLKAKADVQQQGPMRGHSHPSLEVMDIYVRIPRTTLLGSPF